NAPISMMSGLNQWGDEWAGLHMEIPAGALGAFSYKDGVPTGGVLWSFGTRMPDAEAEEQERPLLFLYRRELCDSAGDGRWSRGGTNRGEWWRTLNWAMSVPVRRPSSTESLSKTELCRRTRPRRAAWS